MIQVAICDDDVAITGYAESLIFKLGQSLRQKLEVTVFFSGKEFCDYLSKTNDIFNIVLMDIEMGSITGVDAGRKLRENVGNDQTLLIYISSYNNYYKDIIDLNVFCFVPKPFNVDEFNMKLKKAIERVNYQRQFAQLPDFSFQKNGRDIFIPLKSIKYFESKKRIIYIYTTTSTYTYYGSLNTEEKKLPKDIFCRIHRSYLICFAYMTSITAQSVTISDITLPISDAKRDAVKIAYKNYRGLDYGLL